MLANDVIEVAGGSQPLATWFDKMQTAFGNMAESAGGLAIGSVSKKTFRTVNTITYTSGFVVRTKAAAAIALTDNTHDIAASTSSAQEAVYLVCLNAAGDFSVTMGTVASGAGNAKIPDVPAGLTPVGMVRIRVAAGTAPFAATGDDLDAPHLTCTYSDINGPLLPRFDSAI
jgi:hypothetical protein